MWADDRSRILNPDGYSARQDLLDEGADLLLQGTEFSLEDLFPFVGRLLELLVHLRELTVLLSEHLLAL